MYFEYQNSSIWCLLYVKEKDKFIILYSYAVQYVSNGLCEPPGIHDLLNYLTCLEK